MGVELGKVLAKNILAQLEKPEDVKGHDSSVRYFTFIVICHRTESHYCSVNAIRRLLASSTTIRSTGRSKFRLILRKIRRQFELHCHEAKI
jgi:hypothetical protein